MPLKGYKQTREHTESRIGSRRKGKGWPITEKIKRRFSRRGPDSVAWKGGRPKCVACGVEISYGATYCTAHLERNQGRVIIEGYVYVYNPEHPNANKAGRISLARLVMEEVLGRRLELGEVAHHIGDKDDNREENLLLFPSIKEHMRHHAALRRERNPAVRLSLL